LIIECDTEKVLQFLRQLKSIYHKTLVSLNKKCIFEHSREIQTRNFFINCHYFFHGKKILVTFESCPLKAFASITQRCAVPLQVLFLAPRICPVRNNPEYNKPKTRNNPEHIHKSRTHVIIPSLAGGALPKG